MDATLCPDAIQGVIQVKVAQHHDDIFNSIQQPHMHYRLIGLVYSTDYLHLDTANRLLDGSGRIVLVFGSSDLLGLKCQ